MPGEASQSIKVISVKKIRVCWDGVGVGEKGVVGDGNQGDIETRKRGEGGSGFP